MAKKAKRDKVRCEFCTDSARFEVTGSKLEDAQGTERAVAHACWRDAHLLRAKAFLSLRGFHEIQARVL